MAAHEASRTLVKSSPELWAECSDAASLARHLDQFGEIRITKLEPETAVAWEGDAVRGAVRLEPSGWGTRVTLTATAATPAVEVEVEPELELELKPEPELELELKPEPEVVPEPEAVQSGVLARLLGLFRRRPEPAAEAEASTEPEAATEPEAIEPEVSAPADFPAAALDAALDSLGQAHRRPFSRA